MGLGDPDAVPRSAADAEVIRSIQTYIPKREESQTWASPYVHSGHLGRTVGVSGGRREDWDEGQRPVLRQRNHPCVVPRLEAAAQQEDRRFTPSFVAFTDGRDRIQPRRLLLALMQEP